MDGRLSNRIKSYLQFLKVWDPWTISSLFIGMRKRLLFDISLFFLKHIIKCCKSWYALRFRIKIYLKYIIINLIDFNNKKDSEYTAERFCCLCTIANSHFNQKIFGSFSQTKPRWWILELMMTQLSLKFDFWIWSKNTWSWCTLVTTCIESIYFGTCLFPYTYLLVLYHYSLQKSTQVNTKVIYWSKRIAIITIHR